MKLNITQVLLVISLFFCGCGSSGDEEQIKQYQVESGFVEYKLEGLIAGTKTVYFDRWGLREARYENIELKQEKVPLSQKKNNLIILDDQWWIDIDLDSKTGTKMRNPNLGPNGKLKVAVFTDEELEKMGGVKLEPEEVAGKLCEVWEWPNAHGSKSWIWKGLQLKHEVRSKDGKIQMK